MKLYQMNPDEIAHTFERLYVQSPFFALALAEIAELHILKNQDYANDGPFSNFEISARYASSLLGQEVTPAHSVAVLRGTKFARLTALTQSQNRSKKPNFESIQDTELDFTVYKLLERAQELQAEFTTEKIRQMKLADRRARRQLNGAKKSRKR